MYASALTFALLAAAANAAPATPGKPGSGSRPLPVSQKFTKFFNANDLTGLVGADRNRAIAAHTGSLAGDLPSGGGGLQQMANVGSAHAVNDAIYYLTNVQIGNPSVNYGLIIDTGSSNTWIGAKTSFVASNTTVNTGARFAVNYAASSVSGNLYVDKVALSSTLSVASQQIGVSTKQSGFSGVDGILGLGPVGLTKGTTSQGTSVTVPTITDNLFNKGVTAANVVSLSFAPTTAVGTTNGEITFGGTDSTQYNSALTYTPLTTKNPANAYWGIDTAVSYGSTTLLSGNPAIVESGLTLLYLASDAYKKYVSATGAVMDKTTGLLTVTAAQYAKFSNLTFKVGSTTLNLIPDAQVWPRSLNSAIGGKSGQIYLVVADLGTTSGAGLDAILGQVWMERFYTTFDTTGKRVGFATTQYTNSQIN